jgi:hypothetical protein
MRRSSIFAAFLTILLFAGPIMACAVPEAQLTPQEKQCCREMGGGCQPGGSDMPMSHSCCKTTVQPRADFRPTSTISAPAPLLLLTFIEPPAAFFSASQFSERALWLTQSHAPPGEAIDASSPLRI